MFKRLLFIVLTVTSCCIANNDDFTDAFERYKQALIAYGGKAINAEIQSCSDNTYVGIPLSVGDDLASILSFARNETRTEMLQFLNLKNVDEAEGVLKKVVSLLGNQPEGSVLVYGSVFVADFNHIFTETFKNYVYDITKVTVAFNADFRYPDRVRNMVNNMIESQSNCSVKNTIPDSEVIAEMNQLSAYHGELFYVELPVCNPKTSVGIYYDVNNTVKTQFTYQKKIFDYAFNKDLQAEVVRIPFKDDFFEKILIIPTEKDGYIQVAQNLASNPDLFLNLLKSMKPALINLGLPDYDNITKIVDSRKNLQMVSDMKTLFDTDTAQFENVTTCGKVGLEAFLQKVEITYNVVQATDCDCTCEETNMEEYNVLADRPTITYFMRQGVPLVVFVDKVRSMDISNPIPL